jgi:hypothetical protein
MAWPKGKSRKTGETMTQPKKSIDDLVAETNAAKGIPDDAPNKKAIPMPSVSNATREQMLAELAVQFNTTPDEVAKTLQVGDPVAIAPSPNGEIEELPAGTKLVPVKLTRDYWAHRYSKAQWPIPPTPGLPGDNRCLAGSTLRLPGKEARRLIESGSAVRDDPMPDEAD